MFQGYMIDMAEVGVYDAVDIESGEVIASEKSSFPGEPIIEFIAQNWQRILDKCEELQIEVNKEMLQVSPSVQMIARIEASSLIINNFDSSEKLLDWILN
jgi:hypothetical protein